MTLRQNTKRKFLFLTLTILFCAAALFAQGGSVDLSFNASVSKDLSPSEAVDLKIALQPDGKIIVFGRFETVNGVQKAKVVRLSSDGSVDASFNCACNNFTVVTSVVIQPDGKLVIGGYFQESPFGTSSRLARLNPDGSRDNSFVSPFSDTGGLNSYATYVLDIQADGKLFVYYTTAGQFGFNAFLYRLNPNGSFDNTFATMNFFSGSSLSRLQVLPSGKIMMSGNHNFGTIFRVNPDGTKDTTFESPSMVSSLPMSGPSVNDFAFQSNGKIVITGNFSSINGVSRLYMARLNPDGSLDLTYQNTHSAITLGTTVEVLSNDKILIRTGEGAPNSQFPYFFRLNPDGTDNGSFTASPKQWRVDAQDRVVYSYAGTWSSFVGRINADGSVDNSFTSPFFGYVGEVTAVARQTDGKIIIGGIFNRVNGIEQGGISRLNSDGSLDATFNIGSGNSGIWGANAQINAIAVQADGKILIGGTFLSYNGSNRQYLARLNADGSWDGAFNAIVNDAVNAIALQTDGKILIGGTFTSINSTNRPGLARINSDGSLDSGFNPIMSAATVYTILVQTDGKIMVGGAFSGVNGFNRQNLVRFNADSSLDAGFNAGSIAGVFHVLRQTDGKYLALHTTSVTRRNADGSLDGSFTFPTTNNAIAALKRMLLQSDGSIVLVGSFAQIGGVFRNNIARLRSNGTIDTAFFPVGADRRINDIVAQPDGKFIVGGAFKNIENVSRAAIARITAAIARRIINFDYDGDGKSDISVFRPSENKWYVLKSSNGQVVQQVFAIAGDVPVPADFDGDGKTDFAIYRASSGDWWYLSSLNGTQGFADWGEPGVIPRPSDFDGDGKADYIFFLPANSTWYRYGTLAGASFVTFGLSGDKPVTGDFDGDGKSDVAIYRPSDGNWWWQSSVDNVQRATHWGISTDIPAPADFDGDGKTDFCVYRPSTGTWYIYNSATNSSTILNFGISEDKPVPADYDGDGRADIAVFRPSTGTWYLMKSTEGFAALQFGVSTDIPTENAFVP
jgi:uncharacterized delta-60 repeat protein